MFLKRSEAQASISPIFLGAGLQEVAKNKKSSWGVQYDYTQSRCLFRHRKQTPDYLRCLNFMRLMRTSDPKQKKKK